MAPPWRFFPTFKDNAADRRAARNRVVDQILGVTFTQAPGRR
jgi:hypothetical protein